VVAVIGLGRNLRFQVIAESVGNADQQFRLRAPGCHKAQGYFCAKLMAASPLPPFLLGWPGRDT